MEQAAAAKAVAAGVYLGAVAAIRGQPVAHHLVEEELLPRLLQAALPARSPGLIGFSSRPRRSSDPPPLGRPAPQYGQRHPMRVRGDCTMRCWDEKGPSGLLQVS